MENNKPKNDSWLCKVVYICFSLNCSTKFFLLLLFAQESLFPEYHRLVLQLLAKLLKSKNPDDLQEANKLIKSMVKEVRTSCK